MDKLYSKYALTVKAVACFLLGPLCVFLLAVINSGNWFVYFGFSNLLPALLYAVPFCLSFYYIRKYKVLGIKKYVLKDLVFCLLPVLAGFIITESFLITVLDVHIGDGFITATFFAISAIITLVFWGLYLLAARKK